MTHFDVLKQKDVNELAAWLDKHGSFDGSPWGRWWDEHYCDKCEAEVGYLPELDRECVFAWCELHHKCKFFQDMNEVPDGKEIVKMWLESEVDD